MNGHAHGDTEYSVATFKPLLSKLLQRPESFTPADLRLALLHFASRQISSAQTGSFLASLKVTNVWRKPELVQVLVGFMQDLSGSVKVGASGNICDWTFTGESGLSVINVALPAAIVAAGAGCRVVKHGNASSPWPSTPSSGDILTALSVPTTSLPPFSITKIASSRHVPFLHIYTPRYSPHLAALSPLRRELGFETIFHSLACLISPAKRDYLVIGVHEERLGQVFVEGCKSLQTKRAWIVHGRIGLDAISTEGETLLWELKDGAVTARTLSPADFGVQEHPLAAVQLPKDGSHASLAYNNSVHAKIIASLLSPRRLRANGPIVAPYEPDAYGTVRPIETQALEDFVCMNAAALLVVSGRAGDEREGMRLARKSLKEGKAYHALEALRDAAALAVDVDEAESTI
ncbi:MAG: anthranilate phosphoribosyltransferase [Cyphobasidiales sp. Tagirdzhanova-0007]|nr:MAG: anthranilate phosphoribosyltransferase [Cyphobasidiales sp. Tagirdzhanova-0007]